MQQMTGLLGGSYSKTVSIRRVFRRQSTAEAEVVWVGFQVLCSAFISYLPEILHMKIMPRTLKKCFSSINEMIAENVVLERSR